MSRGACGKGAVHSRPFFSLLNVISKLTNNQSDRNRVKILGKKDFACVC